MMCQIIANKLLKNEVSVIPKINACKIGSNYIPCIKLADEEEKFKNTYIGCVSVNHICKKSALSISTSVLYVRAEYFSDIKYLNDNPLLSIIKHKKVAQITP